jgi:hypothetical protein
MRRILAGLPSAGTPLKMGRLPLPGTLMKPLFAALKAFALWMVGGLAFLQSLLTVIAWWQGRLADPDWLDIFWLCLAPLMAYLYLRHVSIFGRKQPPCLLPKDDKPRD